MANTNGKKKNRDMKRLRMLIGLLLIAALLLFIQNYMVEPEGYTPVEPVAAEPVTTEAVAAPAAGGPAAGGPDENGPIQGKTLDVYVLDVGQGDSIFLKSPSGKTMLVDASESGEFQVIDGFLKKQGVEKLDVVIGTHPHADHIGAMTKVIQAYEVGAYYMPDATATTKTFERLLDTLAEKKVPVHEAYAGEDSFIHWDEAVEIRILSPQKGGQHKDLNNASVVCRVAYGETAILLTGDAETPAENTALLAFPASYWKATILKLGHHGSSTSTGAAFFEAVQPEAAIASLGEGNSYGHPHKEIIALLEENGVPFYRTDLQGTIHVSMDGHAYTIETEK